MRILLRMASDSLLTPVTSIKSVQNKVTGIVGKIVSILMLPAFTNKAIFKQLWLFKIFGSKQLFCADSINNQNHVLTP